MRVGFRVSDLVDLRAVRRRRRSGRALQVLRVTQDFHGMWECRKFEHETRVRCARDRFVDSSNGRVPGEDESVRELIVKDREIQIVGRSERGFLLAKGDSLRARLNLT